MDWKEKLADWWLFDGLELVYDRIFHLLTFRKFRRGIWNLILWFPTIWYDRQWDEYYFYGILRFKFQQMEKFYKDSNWACSADADEVAHQFRICRILCERILKDDYTTPYEERIALNRAKRKVKIEETGGDSFLGWISIKIDDPPNKVICWGFEHENMLHNQDIDYLTKMIRKYSRNWWD